MHSIGIDPRKVCECRAAEGKYEIYYLCGKSEVLLGN